MEIFFALLILSLITGLGIGCAIVVWIMTHSPAKIACLAVIGLCASISILLVSGMVLENIAFGVALGWGLVPLLLMQSTFPNDEKFFSKKLVWVFTAFLLFIMIGISAACYTMGVDEGWNYGQCLAMGIFLVCFAWVNRINRTHVYFTLLCSYNSSCLIYMWISNNNLHIYLLPFSLLIAIISNVLVSYHESKIGPGHVLTRGRPSGGDFEMGLKLGSNSLPSMDDIINDSEAVESLRAFLQARRCEEGLAFIIDTKPGSKVEADKVRQLYIEPGSDKNINISGSLTKQASEDISARNGISPETRGKIVTDISNTLAPFVMQWKGENPQLIERLLAKSSH